jgi:transcriptional regulator with XRE-family HTH domain
MSFYREQCRAARALIGWSQDQLASASKVAKATIANFEAGKRDPYPRTLDDLRQALENAGIEFTNGGQQGVRLKLIEARCEKCGFVSIVEDQLTSVQSPVKLCKNSDNALACPDWLAAHSAAHQALRAVRLDSAIASAEKARGSRAPGVRLKEG